MKKSVKFISAALILICLFSTALPAFAAYEPEEFSVDAQSALLLYLGDKGNTTVYTKNADQQRAPASLTKIATAATAFSKGVNLDAVVTVSSNAIRSLDGTGSEMGQLKAGEEVTVRQLMYLIMLHSAGDACNALAEYVAGSIEGYVAMMNEWAKSVGCENTQFMNTVGLDKDGHYSTADDLAKMTLAAMEYPDFVKISETPSYQMEATNKNSAWTVTHKNSLLNKGTGYYYSPAKGIKTGTTTKAGYCVITAAEKDGYKYLCVVLGSVFKDYTNDGLEDNGAFFDAKRLFQWAFSNFRLKELVKQNTVISSLPVKNAKDTDVVQLIPKEKVAALVPASLDESALIFKLQEGAPAGLEAPVKKGDPVGTADIIYANETIATVEVVAGSDIQRSLLLFVFNSAKEMLQTVWAKVILALVILLILCYIVLTIVYNKRKKKRRMRSVKDYRKL